MIRGVSKVIIDVDDQDRAKTFWLDTVGFRLLQDSPYDKDTRWLEVASPDGAIVLVLSPRHGEPRREAPEMLPTSNVFFHCDDLESTHRELEQRGVVFAQAPIKQEFGWWSMFVDTEGNRFALVPAGQ
jgi:lactoylglutathione lyase